MTGFAVRLPNKLMEMYDFEASMGHLHLKAAFYRISRVKEAKSTHLVKVIQIIYRKLS